MSGFLPVGYIAKQGEDIFPTTAPHLDVRVKKGGKYIDPSTWRSGLQNLLIGEEKKPLYQQVKDGFTPSFPVTSGYGPRKAPVAGASTYHKGIDFGIAGGTPLYWRGKGAFKPGQGLGTIQTPEGFEIELLHTKGGKAGSLDEQTPQVKPPQQPAFADAPQSINIVIETGGKEEDEDRISPQEQLQNYIKDMLKPKSPFSIGSLAKTITSMPSVNYFG